MRFEALFVANAACRCLVTYLICTRSVRVAVKAGSVLARPGLGGCTKVSCEGLSRLLSLKDTQDSQRRFQTFFLTARLRILAMPIGFFLSPFTPNEGGKEVSTRPCFLRSLFHIRRIFLWLDVSIGPDTLSLNLGSIMNRGAVISEKHSS